MLLLLPLSPLLQVLVVLVLMHMMLMLPFTGCCCSGGDTFEQALSLLVVELVLERGDLCAPFGVQVLFVQCNCMRICLSVCVCDCSLNGAVPFAVSQVVVFTSARRRVFIYTPFTPPPPPPSLPLLLLLLLLLLRLLRLLQRRWAASNFAMVLDHSTTD